MTDLLQEERLKSDQLRSLTECEQVIYAIAKKTGKSPLDIWRVNEIELSEQASKVDWDIDRNRLWLVLVNLFAFGVIVNYYLVSDWPRVVGLCLQILWSSYADISRPGFHPMENFCKLSLSLYFLLL